MGPSVRRLMQRVCGCRGAVTLPQRPRGVRDEGGEDSRTLRFVRVLPPYSAGGQQLFGLVGVADQHRNGGHLLRELTLDLTPDYQPQSQRV